VFPEDEDSDRFDRTMSVRRVPVVTGEVVDKRAENRRQSNTRILSVTLIVIAILFIARTVLVPIALAILFSFLLTPIVRLLERSFLRRTGAIVLSLGLTIAGLAFSAWWMYQQFSDVAREISQAAVSGHIEEKLKFLRTRTGGTLAVFERTLQRVADARGTPEKADLKVRVIPDRKGVGERYDEVAPQVEVAAAGFLVIVLVFFVLQDREQLRDKMLRLAGRAHLTVTTQAIGETSERISQYLLTIALLNIGFGTLIGVGLLLLQVPHAGLWGIVAGLLRFVPYIGAVLSAAGFQVIRVTWRQMEDEPYAVIARLAQALARAQSRAA